ncbi:pro-cathepsin H-like [Oscarella lobularis]|uniref:pro-cathepsin H-like n=1 Tax=Oscarella lobularis TaxID=121494 RepID=UPI00331441B6
MASRLPFLLAFAIALGPVCAQDVRSESFLKWMKEHNKSYETKEELLKREKIFERNLAEINEHNAKNGTSYERGLNAFSDMEFEEFKKFYLITSPQNCSATNHQGLHVGYHANLPRSIDWRTRGIVTPVKNQGRCGSCWTFSTTGALECHHALATGDLVSLSEQNLVDCAGNFDNNGCDGGLPSHAFEYIHYNKGIESEEDYPYVGKDSKCKFNLSKVAATVKSSFNITKGDEEEIVRCVALNGPVSIAYDVVKDFSSYKKGVYKSDECHKDASSVNHAVLAVGYGETDDGQKYWIVKNSWGASWGMNGYFWMERGTNMCGLAECASYPIV